MAGPNFGCPNFDANNFDTNCPFSLELLSLHDSIVKFDVWLNSLPFETVSLADAFFSSAGHSSTTNESISLSDSFFLLGPIYQFETVTLTDFNAQQIAHSYSVSLSERLTLQDYYSPIYSSINSESIGQYEEILANTAWTQVYSLGQQEEITNNQGLAG